MKAIFTVKLTSELVYYGFIYGGIALHNGAVPHFIMKDESGELKVELMCWQNR